MCFVNKRKIVKKKKSHPEGGRVVILLLISKYIKPGHLVMD